MVEVVLTTDPNMVGEAPAAYIAGRLRDRVRVSRLASGLPVGGNLECGRGHSRPGAGRPARDENCDERPKERAVSAAIQKANRASTISR